MDKPMSKLGTMLQVGRTFGIRDGMLRLEYELQRGSGLMSWRMRSVQGWDSWDLQRIAPGVRVDEIKSVRQDGARPFFFADAQTLGSSVRNILGAAGEGAVLAEAERILAGHLPFFGQLSFNCQFPPRWFENPLTAQTVSPQLSWTQMRFASPHYGDLKFILEPSRFLFVYPLLRAYALSGDERFAQAFWTAIEDWARHSSPMAGPLWICGQECSLRILAWSFGLHGFIHSPSSTAERIKLLVSMIAAHAWRTAQTLGYARSQRSNHLIAEAVGLWTAGTLFPELREALVWQNLGAQLLHDAVIDQITPEGVSQQHSFNYQRMILHLLLWTLRLAEIHRTPLHDDIRKRAQAAFDFLRPWIDPVSGLAPNYGSDDGSLILPLALGEHHDYRALLQLGAAVLDRPALNPGPWDEAVLWFGAEFGTKPGAMLEKKSGAKSAIAEKTVPAPPGAETGYFRLGDDNSWAMIRAGRYTRRPFQADQLHVDLWWQGFNIARDAGTYLYNGPPPWNNGLAGTAVHNTVTVDHRDQMRRAGRFLWLDWAQASGRSYCSSNGAHEDLFEGEHDGYRHSGIRHRRMVQWLPDAGWVIADDMEGTGAHELRLHWLTADLPYEVSESPFQVAFKSGQSRICWNIVSSSPGKGAIVRAGRSAGGNSPDVNTELLGWESPTYGDLRPAVSIVYDTRSRLPVRFVTVVLTGERCRVQLIDDELVVLRYEAEIYRVSVSTKEMLGAKTRLSPARDPKS
jgi:hypothetical protein